jgi:hypothetical protein
MGAPTIVDANSVWFAHTALPAASLESVHRLHSDPGDPPANKLVQLRGVREHQPCVSYEIHYPGIDGKGLVWLNRRAMPLGRELDWVSSPNPIRI